MNGNVNTDKTILFLINGLGIASKDSYDINLAKIMPNMVSLSSNYIYSSLENTAFDYKIGYKNFSLGNNLLPTYNELEKDPDLYNNPFFSRMYTDAATNGGKIHIYASLDNDKIPSQIDMILKVLKGRGDVKIFLHFFFRQKKTTDYDVISKRVTVLKTYLANLSNVEVGMVVGERNVNSELFFKLSTTEMGEKWPDFSRKINYQVNTGVSPRDTKAFCINKGFMINSNDVLLFLNYEDMDLSVYANKFTTQKLYSLFPIEGTRVTNIYPTIMPEAFFCKRMEEVNRKVLILTTGDRMNNINYYLNGLNVVKGASIDFVNIETPALPVDKIIYSKYDYIIFDYDISKYNTIDEVREYLKVVDDILGAVYNIVLEKEYNLFVSSLYGLFKEYQLDINTTVKLDFSLEIPVIVVMKDYPKGSYSLNYGTSYDLNNTVFKAFSKREDIPTLIRKKGLIGWLKSIK